MKQIAIFILEFFLVATASILFSIILPPWNPLPPAQVCHATDYFPALRK